MRSRAADAQGATEAGGRDWAAVGMGLVAAFALVGLHGAAAWAFFVIAEALV